MLWLFTTHYLIVKIKEIRVLFPNISFRVRNQLPYISVVRKRKTRPTSPLYPQTRNSAKESKDADMGHSENVLCAKLGSGSGPICLQYKVRTKDGLANILVLCRILEANIFSKQLW